MAYLGDCNSRIVQLARTISACVTKIDECLLEIGLPSPSFDENTPVAHLPPGISDYQDTVLDATAELHDLLLEPLHLIKKHSGVRKKFQSSRAYHQSLLTYSEQQPSMPPSHLKIWHRKLDPAWRPSIICRFGQAYRPGRADDYTPAPTCHDDEDFLRA